MKAMCLMYIFPQISICTAKYVPCYHQFLLEQFILNVLWVFVCLFLIFGFGVLSKE